MKILNQGFDHVEFIVTDLPMRARTYERMGFERVGARRDAARGTESILYQQGFVRVLLTAALPDVAAAENEESVKFLRKHAEGICVLAIEVDDAAAAYAETVGRGARSALAPETYASAEGRVVRAEIWTPGSVRYAFIERPGVGSSFDRPALFDRDLPVTRLESPSPLKLRLIDHLTNNVDMGQMQVWVDFYTKVFGFVSTRHFDIATQRTGLLSEVMQSPDYKIKVPINEATEPESQVQEFVNRMKGAGVQHLALLTTELEGTLHGMRAQEFKFLTVPHAYYEAVPTRVPGVTESLSEMEKLGILLDGDQSGYLLQIFSEEILGPFFFEFIQRKGNKGFGEGNFKALFEAIERDQISRGVLKEDQKRGGVSKPA